MKKVLILDISAIIYRAHFAMINFRNSKGESNGAILGFVKQLDASINYFNPDYIIAARDVRRKDLKRTEIYSEYKSNRSGMPDELMSQLEAIDEILKGYQIKSIKANYYEADDVIATLTKKLSKENEVIILTGDKDLAQLVNENTTLALLGKKDKEPYKLISTEEDVIDYLGVKSNEIKDLFALMGDSSDSIPGVKGIGPKTGIKLINKYKSIENIYENIDEIDGSVKNKLIESKELAFISKKLATIFDDIDIEINLEDVKVKNKNVDILKKVYLNYELKKEYEKLLEKEIKTEKIEADILELKNISEFINILNKKEKLVSFYTSDEGSSFFDGEVIYYTFDNFSINNSLFDTGKKLSDINNNLNVVIFDTKEFIEKKLKFNNYFDILLAYYTLGTDKTQKIENIVFDNISLMIEKLDKKDINKLSSDEIIEYKKSRLTKIAYGIYVLKEKLEKELMEKSLLENYNFEKKFANVLVYMQENGINIDLEYFEEYNKEIIKKIKDIEKKIYEEAKMEFNISSPKQLGEVLFEKLEIEAVKKNKRGYSTDAEVLELLSDRGIKIATLVLNYRELEKLRSTYIEPMLKLQLNSKIYTTFNQTGTATGRLSSQNPNLQNIPTRTEEGVKIRKGFIAGKDKYLIGFDYSQIELRVLAHLSKDENLLKAYQNNLDLHELTARKIFKLNDAEIVSKYQRNIAKVINFSILYGKTAFGLSKELKIPAEDARKYIKTYFEEYPKVKEFIDKIIENAQNNNYVETLFNTRRYVYDINSTNINIREQAKRMAVNTVIQGTAANIIKKVMLKIYEELVNDKLKLLLQVHDELIFEVDKDYIDIKDKIIEIMEKTVIFENVQLLVNFNQGKSWMELK